MNDKKQIEELAEELRLIKELQASNIYTPNYQEAMALISLGYQKIHEGSANISKEEYETLQKQLDYWKNETIIAREDGYLWFCKAHKQAVKEFANALKSKMVERDYMGVKYKQGVFSDNEIDEIAKEMGVE